MPRTSVSCPRNPERAGPQQGYTLLELLVVLTLVALVAGVVAPAAMNALDGARERGARVDMQALLEALPVRAFREERSLALDGAALARLAGTPDGWRVQLDGDLKYAASGVAEGGSVRLLAPGGAVAAWRVEARLR